MLVMFGLLLHLCFVTWISILAARADHVEASTTPNPSPCVLEASGTCTIRQEATAPGFEILGLRL